MRVWVGGEGAEQWRDISGWPPAEPVLARRYLGAPGTLSSREPAADPGVRPARFRYDPADPTPSPGGALLAVRAGTLDNREVEQRLDVLVFSSEPLGQPVEIIGDVAAELSVTRDNPYADLFVRLCDVDPRGRSRNICDGIVRLADADPLSWRGATVSGAAHRFGAGTGSGSRCPAVARTPASPGTQATGESTRPPPTWCRPGTRSAWSAECLILLLPVNG